MENTSPTAALQGVAVSGHKRRTQAPKPPGTGSYISTTSSSLIINDLGGQDEPIRLTQSAKFSDKKNFQKRARAKYLTAPLSLKLVDQQSKLTKSYWNTYHCSSVLQKKGNTLTTKYCKNRWCQVCCRIMTAKLIRQYLPAIKKWEHKQFVTLSIESVGAEELQSCIKKMKDGFDVIRKAFDNEWRRKKRVNRLVGIRKIEVTYNAVKRTYHPHFHLVIRDSEVAHELRERWLYHFAGKSSWDGQNVRSADDASVLELFKYFTKLMSSHAKERLILVDTLDVIFRAVAGQRTYQAYNVPSEKVTLSDEEAEAMAEQMMPEVNYPWQQSVHDWVNEETGELLTGYEPHPLLRDMVERGMATTNPPQPPNGS